MVESRQRKDPWSSATWEGAALSHLLAGARLSLDEKLAWLQDMGRFYRAVGGDKEQQAAQPANPKHKND